MMSQVQEALRPAVEAAEAQEAVVEDFETRVKVLEVDIHGRVPQLNAIRQLSSMANQPTKAELAPKPSHYPVLDYARESSRLSKLVTK